MNWTQHPFLTSIAASVLAAPIIWLIAKLLHRPKPPTQQATMIAPNSGTVVAVAGLSNTFHVHAPAETALESFHAKKNELERQVSLVAALQANVDRTNEYLRGIIAGNETWSQSGPPLHQKIKENRNEFLSLRPQLAALHRPHEIARIDGWYDDLLELERYMLTQTQVVINLATHGVGENAPDDWHVFPAVKEVVRYKVALNAGMSHAWTCGELRKRARW